jgi:hypothetical protein
MSRRGSKYQPWGSWPYVRLFVFDACASERGQWKTIALSSPPSSQIFHPSARNWRFWVRVFCGFLF